MPGSRELLSKSQQAKLTELVRLHHYSLIVEVLGDKAVPKKILKALKRKKLYRKPRRDAIRRSYQLGKLGTTAPDLMKMSAKKFDRYMAKKGDILSSRDAAAVTSIREAFKYYLENVSEFANERMGEAVDKANSTATAELDPKQRPELFMELARRKALSTLAKDMQTTTTVLVGNTSRIVSTETNNAYQNGRAMEIIRKDGTDANVYKHVRPDACEDCVRVYLDDRGVPIIFKLSDLIANGSNVGKSKSERLAVIESQHPHCTCELLWLPEGFYLDASGAMQYGGAP